MKYNAVQIILGIFKASFNHDLCFYPSPKIHFYKYSGEFP